MTPLEIYLEKDGFRPLVYLKDILEFPLLGIIVNNDLLREKPDQVKKVLAGALKGIAFTKSRRDEVVPLLKDFIGLENLEMAQKAYDRLRDIWPDSGLPTERGLKNVASMAEVPPGVPMEKIVDWTFTAGMLIPQGCDIKVDSSRYHCCFFSLVAAFEWCPMSR
jgi:ABC-type nitrate/sulfonate/bicarbonate transport system substrate-binding protein